MVPLRVLTQIAPHPNSFKERRMGDIVYLAMTAGVFVLCVLAITVSERI